jgi:formamidopyrimidine-DNA glycosylase
MLSWIVRQTQALGKKRSAIKTVIMDQSVLAGVGNWVRQRDLVIYTLAPAVRMM